MKKKNTILFVLLTCVIIIGTIYSEAFVEEETVCGKPMTMEQKIQKALDIAEIQNVAGMHEYYHNAFMHKEEYENIWSRRDDITWTNNTDKYIGQKDFKKFYVDGCPKGEAKRGSMWYHMLTTPVIEVAGDGKTAKGVWMSFGNVTGLMGGSASAQWTQEKYGIDFIKEDGKWKIWHLRTYVDFYTNIENGWVKQNMAAMDPGAMPPPPPGAPPKDMEGGPGIPPPPGSPPGMAKPTEKGEYYKGYSAKTLPVFSPVSPEPYCTWEDTFSY